MGDGPNNLKITKRNKVQLLHVHNGVIEIQYRLPKHIFPLDTASQIILIRLLSTLLSDFHKEKYVTEQCLTKLASAAKAGH